MQHLRYIDEKCPGEIINRNTKDSSFDLWQKQMADRDARAQHDLLRRRPGRRPDGGARQYPGIRRLGQLPWRR